MDRKRKFSEVTSSDEDYEIDWEGKQALLDEIAERIKEMIPRSYEERLQDIIGTCSDVSHKIDEMLSAIETLLEIEEAYGGTIKVQALNGETCTVEAYRFDRAKDVKAKACEKLRLSTERRTLVYNGKELDDMSDLSSIDTSVECKFQLLPKTGLGLVDSVKSLFEYFRNGAHRLVEWFPDFFMDMSRALTEKDLSRISQAIGSGWKHLGAELGISQAEIDQICEDNRKTSMKIFNMLRQWSIQASVNATVNTLHNAMKNCRKVTFDMKAIERVFAGI